MKTKLFEVCLVLCAALFLGACNGGSEVSGADGGCPAVNGVAVPACVRTLTPFPVCGTDYRNYTNPGFAWCACALVLHEGACLAGEGEPCADGGPCGAGLLCSAAHGERCVKTDGGV